MKNTTSNELFRLAAILYADNNYEVSTQTIHKKVVESALSASGNQFMSIPSLCTKISELYDLVFSEEDVLNVILNPKNDGFELSSFQGERMVKLTLQRESVITSKIKDKTIDDYISEFEHIFKLEAKHIIYKFLYELFNNDIQSFQRLTNIQKNSQECSYKLDNHNYNIQEKEIINGFLQWENPLKDKAIFDLSSYAIEYSILTSDSKISIQSLRNKQIYLDTNVIYRALGINGSSREILTRTFLQKFNEVGEKLYISKYTEAEFKDSIKFHVDNIDKFNTPRISSEVYIEASVNEEIYNYYHKWRTNKANSSTSLFLAHIYQLYEQFKTEYKITIENICPYNIDNEDIVAQLQQMSTQILSKKAEADIVTYEHSAYIDAQNILWIEHTRGRVCRTIHDANSFIISTDQTLRRWDYLRNDDIPTVLLPSQWLSIVLRFLNRTNNDYKSFVSFLNLKNNEHIISGEQLQVVLAGIGEITADVETQRQLIDILIDNRFKNILDSGKDNDELYDKAKSFAKSETDKEIATLKAKQTDLENKVSKLEHAVTTTSKRYSGVKNYVNIEKQRANKAELSLIQKVEQHNTEIQKSMSLVVDPQMRRWTFGLPIICVVGLIILSAYLGCSVWGNQIPFNLNIFDYIDSVSGFRKEFMGSILVGIVSVYGICLRLIFKRWFSNDYRDKYRNKLIAEYYKKIKQ